MKTETAIARIMNSNHPDHVKLLKLDNLALRTFPNSPNQNLVIDTFMKLRAKMPLDFSFSNPIS